MQRQHPLPDWYGQQVLESFIWSRAGQEGPQRRRERWHVARVAWVRTALRRPASKTALATPTSCYSLLCVISFQIPFSNPLYAWPTEDGGNDRMWLPRMIIKAIAACALAFGITPYGRRQPENSREALWRGTEASSQELALTCWPSEWARSESSSTQRRLKPQPSQGQVRAK